MIGPAGALLARDLRLAWRQKGDALVVVAFFVLAAVLFPFGVGPDQATLARIAAGIVWVTELLAVMLSLDRLFAADYEDGGLDLLLLAPAPLEILVLAKAAAHWLTTGLPLLLATPLVGLFLYLDPGSLAVLLAALALGAPVLSLLGGLGAALVLGARRGGVLLTLLVLPLALPVLIFGVGAVDAAGQGLSARPHLLILAGLDLGALVLAPWATAAALRQAME